MTCPGELELARALSTGGDAALATHLETCASCRAAWDGARAAIELARELPIAMPSPGRREEMRTAILAAAAGPAQRQTRRTWRSPVIAAAAAAAIGYVALRAAAPPASHMHGKLRPAPGARYVVSSVGADEIIQLSEGALDVEVEPLHAGERFRVMVGASQLEVRGTAFRVTANAQQLVEVTVAHGRVDLTPDHGAPATLAAGQAWHAAPAVTRAASVAIERAGQEPPARPERPPSGDAPSAVLSGEYPAPSADRRDRGPMAAAASRSPSAVAASRSPTAAAASRSPSAVAASRPPSADRRDPGPPAVAASPAPSADGHDREPLPQPSARSAEETAYDDAWAGLRVGDFSRAAGGFARVVLFAPDGPLAEDASFWRAVALARARRSAEAVFAFRDFLDGFPRSPRAGQASAMLGWLLIDARELDDAARRFTAATADPDPSVRDSARAGLAALAHRKK